MEKKKLLVIAGPTASGKTGLGVHLARDFFGEVVSADSMQIYRGMEIATATPSIAERQDVPHHLLGILDPALAECSAAMYTQMAKNTIADIHKRGRLPILVGGTGLYISAVVDGTRFEDIPWDPAVREGLSRWAKSVCPEQVHERLAQCDPELAAHLHPNNQGRILRALEAFAVSGIPMSQWQKKARQNPPPYDHFFVGLSCIQRETLYRRIDLRVEEMLELGLLAEARRMLPVCGKTSVQAIGYKELAPYLQGEASLSNCVDKLKQSTRRYAKRQLTWFRRREDIHWFLLEDSPNGEYERYVKVRNAVHKWIEM